MFQAFKRTHPRYHLRNIAFMDRVLNSGRMDKFKFRLKLLDSKACALSSEFGVLLFLFLLLLLLLIAAATINLDSGGICLFQTSFSSFVLIFVSEVTWTSVGTKLK